MSALTWGGIRMPCVTQTCNLKGGPIIQIGVSLPNYLPTEDGSQPIHTVNALIDTGATKTCISTEKAQAFGFEAIGKATMSSASHNGVEVNRYQGALYFYLVKDGLPFTHEIQDVEILEYCNASDAYDILIGRDILVSGMFVLNLSSRSFTFCL